RCLSLGPERDVVVPQGHSVVDRLGHRSDNEEVPDSDGPLGIDVCLDGTNVLVVGEPTDDSRRVRSPPRIERGGPPRDANRHTELVQPTLPISQPHRADVEVGVNVRNDASGAEGDIAALLPTVDEQLEDVALANKGDVVPASIGGVSELSCTLDLEQR